MNKFALLAVLPVLLLAGLLGIPSGTPVRTAVQDGLASDLATWGGTLPTAADYVVIPADRAVTVDAPQSWRGVDVQGTLNVNEDLTLSANGNVRDTGTLNVKAFISFLVEDDRKFVGGETDAGRNDTGLWIEGLCNIEGEVTRPYVEMRLDGAIAADKYGVLRQVCTGLADDPVGWLPDDSYLCLSPDGTITRCEYGNWKGMALLAGDQVVRPRVVNLTRTAGVRGREGNRKSHVIVLHNGVLRARYAAFVNLGPKGIKGRYPVHLHRATCDCPNGRGPSTISECSIYSTAEPSNRGIAIHDTFGHKISSNVIYKTLGHAMFMEEPKGREYDNTIVDNVTIDVAGGSRILDLGSGPKLLDGVEIVANDEEKIYPWTSHYWVRPGNSIRNNLAVGGQALGCVVMLGKGGTESTIEGQQCWGVGDWGIQNAGPTTWKNPIVTASKVAGYASIARWIDRGDGKPTSDAGTRLIAPCLLLNGVSPSEKNTSYRSQVFVNQSPDIAIAGGTLAGEVGLAVHYTSNLRVEGASINANTLVSMTYWESPVLISSCDVTARFITDRPYAARMTSHGPLRLVTTLNGKGIDKTFVSGALLAQTGLKPLSASYVTYSNGVQEAVAYEIPPQSIAKPAFPANVKYVRLWQAGQSQPTTWPLSVSTFGGLIPGKYQAVGWGSTLTDAAGKLTETIWTGEVIVGP